MPSAEELSQTLRAHLTEVGLDASTIEQRPYETIVPARQRLDTAGERAMTILDELGASTLERKLVLHGTIGEGGMGVVRLGTQRSLGREVAVKSLKEDHKNPSAILKLMREAWVTGGLEHPNVVPVYDIALEPDGSPLIVLKKIEGVHWGSLIGDARLVRDRYGADDLLEWNLRVFMQLCNAVRFAHSRFVLHRDLKPENVMVGPFGEVYLVDWGIAVALEDDGSGRMPLAADALEMAGTPLYMAPEMLGGKESRLSERTDIYLLGATLSEVVTGEAPHRGSSFMEIVASIAASEPELPDAVPEELARIVRRAMDPDPDARFENAEQVRLAVQGFLKHRDAARLADRASERMRELLSMLEAGGARQPEDREAVYHLFGECRFGFRHALEVWPGNHAARAGLDRAIEAMVEHELALSEPEAARALLTEMQSVPEALAERVAEARRLREKEDERIRLLEEDLDPARGRRTRSFLASVLGLLWTGLPLLAQHHVSSRGSDLPAWVGVTAPVGLLAVMLVLGFWARDSMMRTAINRRLGLGAVAAVGFQLVARLVALVTLEPLSATFHQSFLVWAAILVMLAATVDWRLLVSAAGFVAAYVVLPFVGIEYAFYATSITNAVLLVNACVLWARPNEDMIATGERMRARIRERHEQRRRWFAERFSNKPSDAAEP